MADPNHDFRLFLPPAQLKQVSRLAYSAGAKSPLQVAETIRIGIANGADPETAIENLRRTRPDLFYRK